MHLCFRYCSQTKNIRLCVFLIGTVFLAVIMDHAFDDWLGGLLLHLYTTIWNEVDPSDI